jgi:D-alanyl-lipoteichoic acid acyltransferase DltB (MBOAT superfamily)
MLFNSPEFIFLFLPIAVIAHFALARWSVDAAVVGTTVSSLVFYAWWNTPFVVMPMLSVAGNFALARIMLTQKDAKARPVLIFGIVANLLILGYFKYWDFLLSIFDGHTPSPPNVPLALSFTTFVQIAFLVDVYRRRMPVDFRRYALFVSFFPHLIAGPIVRWSDLGPQIGDRARYRVNWDNVALGLTIFTCGLFKKVIIADQLAIFVAPVFNAAAQGEAVTGVAAWAGAFAYSAQLYFDFSGYSDMAVGLGLLFNLRLPINFAAPFRACSIIDLWRRWHITLSRFLRDFVYIPLGGARTGHLRTALNLLLTMMLGGLWHGAGWTFIAWGAFHGILLAINHLWRTWRGERVAVGAARAFGWLATFTAFAVGMVFFRASDIGSAWSLLQAMAGFGKSTGQAPITLVWDNWLIAKGYVSETFVRDWFGASWTVVGSLWTMAALSIALLVPDTMEIVNYRENEPASKWRRSYGALVWHRNWLWLGLTTAAFALVFAQIGRVSEFLYYQF